MVYSLLLATLLFADEPAKSPRKPSSIAPSLPELTKEEEAKLDDVIARFIRADTGLLRGQEAKKATDEFDKLGPEAIPALIRGLNHAATLKHSCPVLMITKKLSRLLSASEDERLLEFARDEIGAGVSRSPHSGTLQDLRVKVMLRKNALARRPPPSPKSLQSQSTSELAKSASVLRGAALHAVLRELAKRDGKDVAPALAVAASSYDKETQKLGRELLDSHVGRQSLSMVQEMLGEDSSEVKKSALRVIGSKHESLVPRVIDRLTDEDASVRAQAHEVLKQLGQGEDYGPGPKASPEQQREAQKRWREWWEKKVSR